MRALSLLIGAKRTLHSFTECIELQQTGSQKLLSSCTCLGQLAQHNAPEATGNRASVMMVCYKETQSNKDQRISHDSEDAAMHWREVPTTPPFFHDKTSTQTASLSMPDNEDLACVDRAPQKATYDQHSMSFIRAAVCGLSLISL